MYGLIGYPLGHSFSKKYFTEKFAALNLNESYELFPIENIDLLLPLISENPELCGLNVTIPYKEKVFKYLSSISDAAKNIGAVNVISISHNNDGTISLLGDNSDWKGFAESLKPFLNPEIKSALILGTGGAAKAVRYALSRLGIKTTSVSRTPTSENEIAYSDLSPEIMKANKLIVNTTPLGMHPNTDTCPEIPYILLSPQHLCFDLVYNPEITEFMKRSAENGATVKNGLEMLHNQADIAWEIWKTQSPERR